MTSGRAAFVTGAASGIGRAVCRRLVDADWTVGAADLDADGLTALHDELGSNLLVLPTDVGDEDAVTASIGALVEHAGGLDAVASCAGIHLPDDTRPADEVDLAVFERTLRTNLTGTFLVCKHALPHLEARRGAIVTIASTAALQGTGLAPGYSASKGGVLALSRLLAVQYGPRGVRVNTVCPGGTDTPMLAGVPVDLEKVKAAVSVGVPLGRLADPDELAAAVTWLLGEDASYLTGATIVVDGGATIA